MTKHVIDHPTTTDSTRRAREYSRIDADEMPRPQTKTLQRRVRDTNDTARLKAYANIERRSES